MINKAFTARSLKSTLNKLYLRKNDIEDDLRDYLYETIDKLEARLTALEKKKV